MLKYKIAALLVVLSLHSRQCISQIADLILHNGKLFTSDTQSLYAEALAISGNRIVAVGKSAEVLKRASSKTKIIDLENKTVIAGINDAHDHIGYGAPAGRFLAFSEPMLPGPTLQQVIDSIKIAVQQVPASTLIHGHIGLRIIEDSTARRNLLDKIAPLHPVILHAPWGHGTVLNTKAMEMLKIEPSAPDPLGGRYERTPGTNKASGLLQEYAEFEVQRTWHGMISEELLVNIFNEYGNAALKMGITSVQNMSTSLDLNKTVSIVKAADMQMRVRVIRFPGTNENGRKVAEWARKFPSNSKLQVSGMKWILDGTPLERGAFMKHDYSDKAGSKGILNFPMDTIRLILHEAALSNEQLILHLVGDETPGMVIREMLKIRDAAFWKKKRVRFEHGDGILPEHFDDIKKLGIVVVVNPSHFMFAEVNHQRIGAERAKHYQPLRSLLQAGIPVAFGSDGPNNPFLNIMFAAIHATNPEESITPTQAIIAYTTGSAFAEFQEKEKGMLKAGQLADISVLSQNIFDPPLDALPATQSLLTIVDGKIVYDAGALKSRKR